MRNTQANLRCEAALKALAAGVEARMTARLRAEDPSAAVEYSQALPSGHQVLDPRFHSMSKEDVADRHEVELGGGHKQEAFTTSRAARRYGMK